MNKKALEMRTIILLLLAIILLLFVIFWYTGLKDKIVDLISRLFLLGD